MGKPYPQWMSGMAMLAFTMPGSVGDVGDLLQGLLVTGLREQARVGVHAPGHAHGALGRDLVGVFGGALDAHASP